MLVSPLLRAGIGAAGWPQLLLLVGHYRHFVLGSCEDAIDAPRQVLV
jgi:hypothetical protein